jgi:hypothetical protein
MTAIRYQVAQHDQDETRNWLARDRGLYVATTASWQEWVSPAERSLIACYVSLRIAAAALRTQP